MRPSRGAALLVVGAGYATALDHSDLTGTWTTKSNSTITGPGFYDAISDSFIEPAHPGFSYSFTDDGHWESAYYRAIANPTSPECASSILQFQHGTFEQLSDGSLVLTPIASDGRQLESAPCRGDKAIHLRYNQSEIHERYASYIDPYHGIPRLDLFQFNGAPLPPMYLVYNPPQMVPTKQLHPPEDANTTTRRMKRSLELKLLPKAISVDEQSVWLDRDTWWWVGLGMTGVGSLLYYCF